jgi:hypothetical protein
MRELKETLLFAERARVCPLCVPEQLRLQEVRGECCEPDFDKGIGGADARVVYVLGDEFLPTPVSPISRTDESDAEMVSMREMIVRIASLCVMSDSE